MARKQSDYLDAILADDEDGGDVADQGMPEGPSPDTQAPSLLTAPSRAGLSLLGRESALARLASGEVKQVTQLQVDPERVRIWPGNARMQHRLSEESVRDLIDSMIAEGGQKVAAVVRRVIDDPLHDYEVIAGTRRHFAISWLRAHSYPDMRLLVQVADLDDEAAFRLADLENRARKDVTDIERARNYASALASHYGGSQARMAERLKLSKGWLSKMLKAAALPDAVLGAFSNLAELSLNPAYALALAMEERERSVQIVKEAASITNNNNVLLNSGREPLAGSEVHARLMRAGKSARQDRVLFAARSGFGRPMLTVTAANRHGLTVKIHAGAGATEDEILAGFREALSMHKIDR